MFLFSFFANSTNGMGTCREIFWRDLFGAAKKQKSGFFLFMG